MKLDPDALEKARAAYIRAVDDTDDLIAATITAYLDALVESGRAKACHAWVSDHEGIFDADFEPIEGTTPALIIRLDGGAEK